MSAKWWPFCLELNMLTHWGLASSYELTQYECSISIVLTMEILQPWTNDVGSVTWENVLMKFLYHGGTGDTTVLHWAIDVILCDSLHNKPVSNFMTSNEEKI